MKVLPKGVDDYDLQLGQHSRLTPRKWQGYIQADGLLMLPPPHSELQTRPTDSRMSRWTGWWPDIWDKDCNSTRTTN